MTGNNMQIGLGHWMLPFPSLLWHRRVSRGAKHLRASLGFMTPEHHKVRDFAVRELPRLGKPIPPEFIGQNLGLPLASVQTILDDLERHMTFLFRNEDGAVTWAYPVTVDSTPHRLSLSTGDHVNAA
jgi:hypothetical protein